MHEDLFRTQDAQGISPLQAFFRALHASHARVTFFRAAGRDSVLRRRSRGSFSTSSAIWRTQGSLGDLTFLESDIEYQAGTQVPNGGSLSKFRVLGEEGSGGSENPTGVPFRPGVGKRSGIVPMVGYG